jgi:hypothetical protein
MIHPYLNALRHWIDATAFFLAGAAVVSLLQQLAVIVTILAGLGSLSLVALRWHDRLKYGHLDGADE